MLAEQLSLGVVTAVPAIRNWFPGGHDRSLSRSVRSFLSDLGAVERLSMVAIASAARSARTSARGPGRAQGHRPISGRPRRPIPSTYRICRPTKALLKWSAVGAGEVAPPSSSVSGNPRNRCARRRSPRSPPTVDAEGKRSLGVQLNALFQHLRGRSPAITPCRPAAAAGRVPKASGGARSPTTPRVAQVRTGPDPGWSLRAGPAGCAGSGACPYLQQGGRARR
jgi:hypothetical protein